MTADQFQVRGDADLYGLTRPEYRLRRDLQQALRAVLAEWAKPGAQLVVADIGAGDKPWAPLLKPYARRHIGLDRIQTANTDVVAVGEALPLRNVDLVLCTQMLEHAEDPRQYLRECHAALRSGGLAVLSTHGTFVYHMDPDDYWRWTHQGLLRLFCEAGFTVERILACEGAPTVGAFYMAHALANAPVRLKGWSLIAKASIAALGLISYIVDGGYRTVYSKESGLQRNYGETAINYVVVARKGGA